jgi:hypothetical protein
MSFQSRDISVNTQGLVTRVRGLIDRVITSLTGSSQQVVGATILRKRLIFKNGANPVAINLLGGTAAIGGAGCITMTAYEGLALIGDDCPDGVVTVIGTAANYFSCLEGR